jgi:hypothetical protein
MLTVASKAQMLKAGGYSYSFDRLSYVNRKARKVFSVEFVQDKGEGDVERGIHERTPQGEWRFYFNSEPSESVRRELSAAFSR